MKRTERTKRIRVLPIFSWLFIITRCNRTQIVIREIVVVFVSGKIVFFIIEELVIRAVIGRGIIVIVVTGD